jgi:hypothetical protein
MLDSVVAICLLISVCLVAALFAAVGTDGLSRRIRIATFTMARYRVWVV